MLPPEQPRLRVVQIGFFTDPVGRAPEELLQLWPSLVDVAEAAAGSDLDVSVVQACVHTRTVHRNGVSYHFLPFGRSAGPVAPDALVALLRQLAPQVLHVHGLDFAADVLALAALMPQVPIVLQDHASRPPRPWRRRLWRRAFAAASGVAFCAREQAVPFARAGLLHRNTRVFEVPECPSRFSAGDQHQARSATGLAGDPCLLWVGHLDRNKDPLTVLEGVAEAVPSLPNLQLWCCFGTAPLLPAVTARINRDARLRERVHLLGRVPHAHVELLMRAADVFVLGSHREGSGYSLIEALACGLQPVVSDIASFRSLTARGSAGALWPCGNARALTSALLEVASRPRAEARAAVRVMFERELSFGAVGRKLAAMYHAMAGVRADERTPA